MHDNNTGTTGQYIMCSTLFEPKMAFSTSRVCIHLFGIRITGYSSIKIISEELTSPESLHWS